MEVSPEAKARLASLKRFDAVFNVKVEATRREDALKKEHRDEEERRRAAVAEEEREREEKGAGAPSKRSHGGEPRCVEEEEVASMHSVVCFIT